MDMNTFDTAFNRLEVLAQLKNECRHLAVKLGDRVGRVTAYQQLLREELTRKEAPTPKILGKAPGGLRLVLLEMLSHRSPTHVRAIRNELIDRGYRYTDHWVNIAIRGLAEEGYLTRVRRGIYKKLS